jgi:hypothetical protein
MLRCEFPSGFLAVRCYWMRGSVALMYEGIVLVSEYLLRATSFLINFGLGLRPVLSLCLYRHRLSSVVASYSHHTLKSSGHKTLSRWYYTLDPQVFFACNSSSIDFSGVAFHRGHRCRGHTTVYSSTPRRSTGDCGTARGRIDGARGSPDAHGRDRRTVVRTRAVSSQRRIPATTVLRQSG